MNKELTPNESIKYKWDIEGLKKIARKIQKYTEAEEEKRELLEDAGLKAQTCHN